jgi:hypothetical protein
MAKLKISVLDAAVASRESSGKAIIAMPSVPGGWL